MMELLLDVDEDSTENDAGADDNSAEPSKEQKMHVPARKQLMFLKRHLSGCPLSKQSRNLSTRGSNLSKYVTDDRGLYE